MNYKGYGIFHLAYLAISVLWTKVSFRHARVIRLPWYIRNRGSIYLGKNFTSGRSLRIDIHESGCLTIGDDVQFNDHCQIACGYRVSIGNNVLFASKVFITDHDHLFSTESGADFNQIANPKETVIEDRCWIGNNVSILKGVRIGAGSIIGAGAIITKPVPKNSVIVAQAARSLVR